MQGLYRQQKWTIDRPLSEITERRIPYARQRPAAHSRQSHVAPIGRGRPPQSSGRPNNASLVGPRYVLSTRMSETATVPLHGATLSADPTCDGMEKVSGYKTHILRHEETQLDCAMCAYSAECILCSPTSSVNACINESGLISLCVRLTNIIKHTSRL